jgi:hypothetical protein
MKLTHNLSNSAARMLFVLALVAGLAFTGATTFGQSQTGFTYNGVAYTSYWYNEYLEIPQGPDGTAAMAAYGVNYATVLATQYQQTYTSTTIAPLETDSPNYTNVDPTTPTDAAVVAAITNLKNAGIKVALKPQVDSLVGYWRGQFEPTDSAAWFSSYQTFIVHYATIAQAQGADLFVIGCEFATLSGSAYQSNWETIISAVRAVYTGPITYAANATSAGDEFTRVSFWDKLDLIGVDGYFPLTNHIDPTLSQLQAAWTTASANVNGFAPLTALQNVQSAHPTLPLIFTELGYTSTAGTNEAPYNYSLTGAYDPSEQANCFEAFFRVFSQESSWVKGVFWWGWSVSPPGTDDQGYSPQNKPAGDVLAQWYGGPNFTLAPAAPTLSLIQGVSSSDSITITDAGGFTGDVTLSASGLPAGVTAAFATNPATGSSLLTLTASSTAAIGASTVTITGTSASGALITSTTIALTVIAPEGFTLGASPSTLPVTQGSSGTSTITVTAVGAFTGDVTLSASGLPSGVTASFATNPTTGSSVLTLTASSTAATGTATVTITGNVPSVCGIPCQIPSASTTINLTVSALPPIPGLTLSALPSSLTVTAGNGGSSTITVTPFGGFTGSVTLTAAITAEPANPVNPPTMSFGSTSPVNITGASAGTATLTLYTTASSSPCGDTSMRREAPWYTGGAALACVLLLGIPAPRRSWRKMLGVVALSIVLAGGMTACGSSGGKACSAIGIAGTTPGAYTITVTATATSGNITGTVPVTLNVQ